MSRLTVSHRPGDNGKWFEMNRKEKVFFFCAHNYHLAIDKLSQVLTTTEPIVACCEHCCGSPQSCLSPSYYGLKAATVKGTATMLEKFCLTF